MARHTQTMVQLNEDLLDHLDHLDRRAAREGVSRSQLIRQGLEAFLAVDREAEIDRRIVEGYRNRPSTSPTPDVGDSNCR